MITTRSVAHDSFTIERSYPVPPKRVFDAWASEPSKARWFAEDLDFFAEPGAYSLEFRIGGRERLDGTLTNGRAFGYEAVYQDIVDGERIVASYDVRIDGRRTSVSLMTVEIMAGPDGTRLVLTEQGAFLDGLDSNAQRVEGATDMLDKLGDHLSGH
jgi:uncharacterized protein YndB with AHSA1/START domain